MYVDDIVITEDDLKMNDSLKYFLGIEVASSKKGILLSQRKYILDLLSKVRMLGCRRINSPMDMNTKLLPYQGAS